MRKATLAAVVLALVALVSVPAVSAVVAGAAAAKPGVKDTRSCGSLPVGITWHVRATRNVACGRAKGVGRAYFKKYPACGNGTSGHCKVQHYRCAWRRAGSRVFCRKARRLVYLRAYK
jgi:hypothetical protein